MATIDHDTATPLREEALTDKTASQQLAPAAIPQSSAGLLKAIESLAKNKDITAERMDQVERLFALHQKMVDREAENDFNNALAAAQAEIQPVAANRINSHTTSTFADLSAIHEACKPIWTKHGFSVVFMAKASTSPQFVCVYGELRHRSGHKVDFSYDWPLDVDGAKGNANKTPIQGTGSAIQYARRYTECMLFDISIGRDNDGNSQAAQSNQRGPQLSSEAADWIATLEEAQDSVMLRTKYEAAFAALDGDGYARNQLIKARDLIKRERGWR